MMAKEVASLDINDFIQERSPYVPLQRGDSQSHLTVTLSSESTSDMGSETGDSDNDSESSGNPSPQNLGADLEFDSLEDSGPKIDKFGSNVEFMEEEGNAATLHGASLERQERLSLPQGYRIPDAGLPYTSKRKGKMLERVSKTSHDKGSRRSARTIAISGAFTPAVDPSMVACRQVEALEWHANLDHGRRQLSLYAPPSGSEVLVTKSEVNPNGSRSGGAMKENTIHSAAPAGGGDDVARTSTADSEGHAVIQRSSVDPTGKVSPSEGDTTGNASGSAATAGGGIEVGTTTGGTKVGAETGGTEGLVTGAIEVGAKTGGMKTTEATVKDGVGEEKVPSSGKVLTTLKAVAVETIILSDGSSSDTDDEIKDGAPAPPVQESSVYAPESDVGSNAVVADVLQQILVGDDQLRPLSPSGAINAQVPLMQSSDPIVKVENDWFRDKEEWRKRKRAEKEAQCLEQERIMADVERSRQ
jgi:hypothetical protein